MENYRVLHVANGASDARLNKFFAERCLEEGTYEDAIQAYRENGLIIPASWSLCFRKLGNESIDVLPYHLTAQKLWCKENGVVYDPLSKTLGQDILFRQIDTIRPDVVFFYAGSLHAGIDLDFVRDIKRSHPFVRCVALMWGDYRPDPWYRSLKGCIDIAFTCNENYREKMTQAGIEAYTNHNTFDEFLYEQSTPWTGPEKYDFLFAGATGYRGALHLQRYRVLKRLLEKTNLICFDSSVSSRFDRSQEIKLVIDYLKEKADTSVTSLLSQLIFNDSGSESESVSHSMNKTKISRLIQRARDKRSGITGYKPRKFPPWYKDLSSLFPDRVKSRFVPDYYELLGSSKVVLNAHRDEPSDYTNIRVLEATGVGSCLLTDKPERIKEMFEPDYEVLTYSCEEECVEKYQYIILNEDERKRIAENGQRRTRKNYTTMKHCEIINDVLKNRF